MTRFSDILGQDTAIDWLSRAYSANRLPHALIFAGPTGVGKSTTARALGQLFLCESPKAAQDKGDTTLYLEQIKGDTARYLKGRVPFISGCGGCDSCRVYEAGNHPDFHLIEREHIRHYDKTGKSKAIDLSIHVLRPELIDPAGKKAGMNIGKVFLIEQADTMNASAQNSILKTLEEPAGRTLIILITDSPGALLPTIRSRCQVVRFAALDESLVKKELTKRGIAAQDAADAAHFSEGSLGTAIKWLEDEVVPHARDLTAKMQQTLHGNPPADLPEWFKKAADAYAEKQLERDELSSKDQATREGLALYLRLASNAFRQTLRSATGEDAERACRAIDALDRAGNFLDANVNVSLVFQQLTLELERQFAGAEQNVRT
jgi:DNA polymerase III subunit delta'